jgi:hypothetical protein
MAGRTVLVVGVQAAALLLPTQAQATQEIAGGSRAAAGSQAVVVQYGVLSTIRKIARCAVTIGVFVTGNALWITKLRKAGGVWKVAKRTFTAKGKRAKLKVLYGVLGNVLGLDQIAEACA